MVTHLLLLTSLAAFSADSAGAPATKADVKKAVQSSEVGDISGYYSCRGVEAGGKKYNGIAVIIKKSDVYLIQWMVGGGSTFSGVAIRRAIRSPPAGRCPPSAASFAVSTSTASRAARAWSAAGRAPPAPAWCRARR